MAEIEDFRKRPVRPIVPEFEALLDTARDLDNAVLRMRLQITLADQKCKQLEALTENFHGLRVDSESSGMPEGVKPKNHREAATG